MDRWHNIMVSRWAQTLALVAFVILLMGTSAAVAQTYIAVGSGSYRLGYPNYTNPTPPPALIQPLSSQPQPPGVKTNLVGANGAIVTSKWWTSLIFQNFLVNGVPTPIPMNVINPAPLSVLSTSTGASCRQWYYLYPNPLPPLIQGPGIGPDPSIKDFREVWVGVGISNAPFGVDPIGGGQGYNAAGKSQPDVAAVEYSTWHLTYDTLYQGTPPGQSSHATPRLRTTVARGSPYMWVEYPDGFPAPDQKPGYPGYPTGPNYPMLQVIQNYAGQAGPTLYLPGDFTTSVPPSASSSSWVGNGGTGTQLLPNSNAIAFTVNGRWYAAFGPPNTYWTWIFNPGAGGAPGNFSLFLTGANYNSTQNFIAVAALPQNMVPLQQAGVTLASIVAKFQAYAFRRPGNTGTPGTAGYTLATHFTPNVNLSATTNNVTGTYTYHLVNVGTGGPAPANSTLFALFPHQQAHLQQVVGTDAPPNGSIYGAKYQYTSTRGFATNQIEFNNPGFYNGLYNGQIRLAEGTGFVLQYTLQNVLAPVLPQSDFTGDQARLEGCLNWDWVYAWGSGKVSGNDSYGWAKLLSAVANNYMIAQHLNYNGIGGTADLGNYLANGLEHWLNAQTGQSTQPTATGFAYDANWNILLPYPPGYNGSTGQANDGFGVATFLNDTHFHFGYFIRAAAVYGHYDPAFVTQYGAMVGHLIRSLAADYNDQPNGGGDQAVYPPYRYFDPYTGSSSAAGAQQYSLGENQESSSEAVNAWYAMLLWANVVDDLNLLNRAAYMYASETDCARRYVFCEDAVTNGQFYLGTDNFCQLYDTSNQVSLFFNQNGVFAREAQHAIEWLPFGGGALYLNQNQNGYQNMAYQAMVNQPPGGDNWQYYIDLIWMYRAFSNPTEAQTRVNAVLFPNASQTMPIAPPLPTGFLDNGDSLAFLYHWIYSVPNLGAPVLGLAAAFGPSSTPLTSVTITILHKFGQLELVLYTYTAYSMSDRLEVVKFSDGTRLVVKPQSYGKLSIPRLVKLSK